MLAAGERKREVEKEKTGEKEKHGILCSCRLLWLSGEVESDVQAYERWKREMHAARAVWGMRAAEQGLLEKFVRISFAFAESVLHAEVTSNVGCCFRLLRKTILRRDSRGRGLTEREIFR